MIVTDMPL